MRPFALFLVDLIVYLLDRIQRFLFLGPILAADGLRSLERLVLEYMGDSGFAGRIVHRADVHVSMERNHRRFMTLDHDEMQAIGERELGDFFLKILERLR